MKSTRHARWQSHCHWNGVITRKKQPFNHLNFDNVRNDERQAHCMHGMRNPGVGCVGGVGE
jgi:hypothetical protein